MSQKSRKYKKVEAFLSKVRPSAPDSPLPAEAPLESVVPAAAPSPAGSRQDFIHGIDRGPRKADSPFDTPPSIPENTLCIPLMVSGTTIGAIQGTGNEAGWTAQEIEIISAVDAQLAQHLETLPPIGKNDS
jgi:hypothetical protein